ncbi:MAG TPA: tyrosine-type recombinase/integrase [Anaerolineales bacterium]|nr:tyrosine-type recombinase/integrase [Anaerolineales bacterium]
MFPKQQIDGFEKYWRRRKPGSSTALHYASDVRIFFKWAEGQAHEAITVHDVDEFIGWQQDLGRAQATIRRRLIALRMFYDYLAYVREEEINNPVITQRHYIDRDHHLPRDIRQIEIEKLFTAIGNHLRDRTIFTLMLHTGMGVGEVVHLRLADIFLFENRPPHLRVIGKGQRERIAYLSATAALLLKEYLSERPDKTEEKVFQNRRGKPITKTGIQLQLAKYCHKANIWITCHQLRHTFACRMIAAEVPVTSVQKMLGHTSIRTTQLYVNVADRQVEQDYHTGIQKVIDNFTNLSEASHG